MDIVQARCQRWRNSCAWAVWALICPAAVLAQAPVEYIQPEPANIAQEMTLTGTVSTPLDATLSLQIAGLVKEVMVDAGEMVEAGEVLIRLDETLEALRLDETAAALREAQTRLSEARRLRKEGRPLAQRGSLSASEFASLEAGAELAAAALARARAQHASQQEQVARHTLRAPFAGVIRQRMAAPGEWVASGMPVLELVAQDQLRVDVQVPQQRFAALQKTLKARLEFDALPGHEIAGEVSSRVAAMDPSSRSFLVRVALPAEERRVAPGMSARVRFQLPGAEQAVAIVRDAVSRFPDGSYVVWLIDAQQRAHRRSVRLAQQGGERVVIQEGLTTDDRVIVRGNETLKPGQAVSARRYQP